MSGERLHEGARVRRVAGVITAVADHDLVMMSIERGCYYGLNPTGRRIWALLAKELSVAELCAALREEFEIDAAVCEREVVDFLTRLAAQSLIRIRDAA